MNTKISHKGEHGTLKAYATGFLLSVILTLAAYFLVEKHLLSGTYLIVAILILGAVQALIQLVLFLHLGNEPKPRMNLMVFLFMVLVLVIIVLCTLWIMYDLNYQMMPQM